MLDDLAAHYWNRFDNGGSMWITWNHMSVHDSTFWFRVSRSEFRIHCDTRWPIPGALMVMWITWKWSLKWPPSRFSFDDFRIKCGIKRFALFSLRSVLSWCSGSLLTMPFFTRSLVHSTLKCRHFVSLEKVFNLKIVFAAAKRVKSKKKFFGFFKSNLISFEWREFASKVLSSKELHKSDC